MSVHKLSVEQSGTRSCIFRECRRPAEARWKVGPLGIAYIDPVLRHRSDHIHLRRRWWGYPTGTPAVVTFADREASAELGCRRVCAGPVGALPMPENTTHVLEHKTGYGPVVTVVAPEC